MEALDLLSGVIQLSARDKPNPDEVALLAIDQIISSLNSMAATQRAMCDIAQALLFELSNGKQGKPMEEE